jgi:periplasmic divalent cation tolerance protein
MTAPDHVIVLTTLPANADVRAFGTVLVEGRVAACVNVLPEMTSIYRWEGKVEQEPERQVVIKTTAARLPDLRERVRSLHPYDVPEFIVLPIIDGSEAYLKWVRESTAPAATR